MAFSRPRPSDYLAECARPPPAARAAPRSAGRHPLGAPTRPAVPIRITEESVPKAARPATSGPRRGPHSASGPEPDPRPQRWGASVWLTALLAIGLSVPTAALAQTISATTYPFAASSGVALEDMSSGTTTLVAPNLDGGVSAVTNIGFDFWFVGVLQTQFSVNSNGLLRVGSTPVQVASTNNLATSANAPEIASYWDDLWTGTNGKVHYKVVGSTPNRKLVVEWQNIQVPRAGTGLTGAATWQCWLYETSGRIEYVYGPGMVSNTAQGGASIGFGSSASTLTSITGSGPTVAYGTANNANTTAITGGTRYAFTPPVPTAPTTLTFTGVTSVAMTLNWTDNASNEVGYAAYRSTDGVTYTFH